MKHWKRVVHEQLNLLYKQNIDKINAVVLFEYWKQPYLVKKIASMYKIDAQIYPVRGIKNYEHPSLRIIQNNSTGDVLYFHTKGVANRTRLNEKWRKYMNKHLISNINNVHKRLNNENFDVAGCLYLCDRKNRIKYDGKLQDRIYFGGNYWLAKADYIRKLPDYDEFCKNPGAEEKYSRWLAELWIGLPEHKALMLDQDNILSVSEVIDKVKRFKKRHK